MGPVQIVCPLIASANLFRGITRRSDRCCTALAGIRNFSLIKSFVPSRPCTLAVTSVLPPACPHILPRNSRSGSVGRLPFGYRPPPAHLCPAPMFVRPDSAIVLRVADFYIRTVPPIPTYPACVHFVRVFSSTRPCIYISIKRPLYKYNFLARPIPRLPAPDPLRISFRRIEIGKKESN